ncbi:hypothetical protein BDZ45DRAFT_714170 [Acephala macrosclerotiorum]|nr:hypothetical protein BDZ45DRAFT_714170 [Acephala macrosclerotiorum]
MKIAITGARRTVGREVVKICAKADDWKVHSNIVNSAFNDFRAAAELGIKRFCYASSVNAIGLAYANQPLESEYFPIDKEYQQKPTDVYALAKQEAEVQAQAFANWFPGMNIACVRIHEVAPLNDVQKGHQEDWENAGTDKVKGCEGFNIIAPTTTQDTSSQDLAKKYFPKAHILGDMSKNQAFLDDG